MKVTKDNQEMYERDLDEKLLKQRVIYFKTLIVVGMTKACKQKMRLIGVILFLSFFCFTRLTKL